MSRSHAAADAAASNGSSAPPASSTSSNTTRKRKRSTQVCAHDANDLLVEELKKIRGKIRESSHLAANYGRAITSIQNHPEPITNAAEAKTLRNIGNYIANQIHAILHKHAIINNNNSTAAATVAATQKRPQPPTTVAAARRQARKAGEAAAAVIAQSAPAPAFQSGRAAPSTANDAAATRSDYMPAQRKQPWYLLRALGDVQATCDTSALAVNLVLVKMQMAGYDGNLTKLRACLSSLTTTHQVICRSTDGKIFLTDRGVRSAALCAETSTADAARPSQPAVARPPEIPPPRSGISKPVPNTVCIELSDSEDEPDSETDTIQAQAESSSQYNANGSAAPAAGAAEPEIESEPIFSLLRTAPMISPLADDLVRDGDEWEIVLILDHREVLSRRNRDILERKLLECNVTCEVRSLHVGDVQWIARRFRSAGVLDEFMLNVIVERKAVHDLSGSIIDRRYTEQKTRLRDSGMSHVIYLVEGSLTQQTTVRTGGLQTALCRTQVQNQFFVQHCQSADESVAFLQGVHMSLLDKLPAALKCRNRERVAIHGSQRHGLFHSKTQPSVQTWLEQFCRPIRNYTDFNAQFRKKSEFTVGELYQMMLMQVHGLSSSRVVALSARFPTFQALVQAVAQGERIDELRYGDSQRRIGAKIHEFLSFLLMAKDYEQDPPATTATTRGGHNLADD